jgi:hypothetical protein
MKALIECCLLTDIFKRSQQSLRESTTNLLNKNQKKVNDFTFERIKEFTGGTIALCEINVSVFKSLLGVRRGK